MVQRVDTIVVGGGQAGLAMSYCLSQRNLEHIILEKARIAESWRTARWDSLVFQFPSWSIKLPGFDYDDGEPDGFASKDKIASFINEYAHRISAPISCGVDVSLLRLHPTLPGYLLETSAGQYHCNNVVAATGSYHRPVVPKLSGLVPSSIQQMHSLDYKNPGQLPSGGVLVVGSGASGVQIAEELMQSGRQVHLCIGRHDKTPRRYRGKDFYWWFEALGIWSRPLSEQPELRNNRTLITGAGGGHTINLRRLAHDGMRLHGRVQKIEDGCFCFADDLEDSLRHGEAWFKPFKARFDDYAAAAGPSAFEADDWEQGDADLKRNADNADNRLLPLSDISSVIWSTGFKFDFPWIKLPVFDADGAPITERGVSPCHGLYFLGLRRTYTIRSGLLAGVGDDAAYLASYIATHRNGPD